MLDHKALKAEYQAKVEGYRARQNKYQRLIDKYKKMDSKLVYPHWMEHYLTPIAEELITHFPGSQFEVSGPFGMSGETSISIKSKDGVLLAFLQFALGDDEILLRDYSKDNGRFSRGTIGQLNGGNHPDEPIPDENTIEWFLDKIKYFHSTTSKWDSAKPKAVAPGS